MIITIDGPTASGKSTIAQMLAKKLGFYYLNTGMLYRALAYLLMKECDFLEQDFSDPSERDLLICLDPDRLIYCYESDGLIKITFNGSDITPFLKTSIIDRAASLLSAHPRVREVLLDFQRRFAKKHSLVVEGRDIGSIVFPNANVKFFLTASIEERARRWKVDRAARGEQFSLQESIEKISERDTRDMQRTCCPLITPEGAIVIDNTGLTREQTVQRMEKKIQSLF